MLKLIHVTIRFVHKNTYLVHVLFVYVVFTIDI